ncbi:basic amino acid ABC transporter substrate-binding protein [Thermosediminibacter litoriperuensis]|uniref:Amino acid ABC transporter substrate-binding protein (PAAT family) n=1 Tax=Thermosediminibacter litoriperuensis TaxID=291989 RepID=A0A5S5AXI9_9FIRM|nr:basic amino acid ABC transporter substrate-binding protein [Thermosediminibacter litoriperuensis]TYP58578.1 amino acid ABC transporter substrate-binding protein (PAAT family) [Thermosediminibacter litoriperuensis]
MITKKFFLTLFILVFIAAAVLGTTGCGQKAQAPQQQNNSQDAGGGRGVQQEDTVDKIKKAGKLVLGTSADYPPFEFHQVTGGKDEIVGFDIDLAKAIAKELGVELEIKDIAFESIIPAVLSKTVDLGIAGFTITEERKKSVNFSDPYLEGGQQIITYKGSGIRSKEDLKGKTIGVQLGTTGEEIAKKIEGAKLKQFDKVDAAMLDLMNKRVEAVIIDFAVAQAYATNNPDKLELAAETLDDAAKAVVIRKEDGKLLDVVNKVIKDLKVSGEYDRLVKKWFIDYKPAN